MTTMASCEVPAWLISTSLFAGGIAVWWAERRLRSRDRNSRLTSAVPSSWILLRCDQPRYYGRTISRLSSSAGSQSIKERDDDDDGGVFMYKGVPRPSYHEIPQMLLETRACPSVPGRCGGTSADDIHEEASTSNRDSYCDYSVYHGTNHHHAFDHFESCDEDRPSLSSQSIEEESNDGPNYSENAGAFEYSRDGISARKAKTGTTKPQAGLLGMRVPFANRSNNINGCMYSPKSSKTPANARGCNNGDRNASLANDDIQTRNQHMDHSVALARAATKGSQATALSSSNNVSHEPPPGLVQQQAQFVHAMRTNNYQARIMPQRVILVTHGQCEGNIDEQLYTSVPDHAMPLTAHGWQQAVAAGRHLRRRVLATTTGDAGVHFIVSPYVRTVETFHGMVSAWCDPNEVELSNDDDDDDYDSTSHKDARRRRSRRRAWYRKLRAMGVTWHEDPRIREQDFGNYRGVEDPAQIQRALRDRHNFGSFYYRFAHGESGSDVYDRVSTFLDSLWRSFQVHHPSRKTYVLVTHGMSVRVLLARYFRYSIEQFHALANPRDCELTVLGHDGLGRLELIGRHSLQSIGRENCGNGDDATSENHHCHAEESGTLFRYTFHRRLRVVPRQLARKVRIRMSYDDTEDEEKDNASITDGAQ